MTNIQVEDLSPVKKKVTFEIPQEQVADIINAQYKDLQKSVQLKGFRRGKAPLNLIRNYFHDQVLADSARKIIEETMQSTLDENKIFPVSVTNIDPEDIDTEKPFKYTAEIEVTPPIEPKDYKGLAIHKTVREFKEESVDAKIKELRERNARLTPLPEDKPISKGDHVVIDVQAKVDDEVVQVLTVDEYHMEIGRGFYLPDFDDHIEGMKAGESKDFDIHLPEDFPRQALAGKTAHCHVTIKEAKERTLPDLDDEFAKDVGDFENLDALKEEVRTQLREEIEQETSNQVENQIIDKLIAANEFEVPDSMVEQQVDHYLNQTRQVLMARGLEAKRIPMPTDAQRAQMRPAAVRTVKAGLLMKAIGEKENIEVTDEDLQAGIEERAKQFGMSVDYLKDQLETHDVLENMKESILQQKIYKFLEDNAEITQETAEESDAAEAGKE